MGQGGPAAHAGHHLSHARAASARALGRRTMTARSIEIDYPLFDADNHYYEPLDLFPRYIDPAFRDRTFQVHDEADGYKSVTFDGKPFGFVGGAGNRQRIRPGGLRARLRGETPPDDE